VTREPTIQIEGQESPETAWVRCPMLFSSRDEAERLLRTLQARRAAGWPRYRVIDDDAAQG
jgi:hypothetical protein